jgi:ankyrin repeat protein
LLHFNFCFDFCRINGIDTCTELLLDTLGEKIANTQDDRGRTPVHAAAFAEQCESLQLLLSNGADVNVTDRLGRASLMLAAANGNCGAIGKIYILKILNLNALGRK